MKTPDTEVMPSFSDDKGEILNICCYLIIIQFSFLSNCGYVLACNKT
jgi:hypothetical protein